MTRDARELLDVKPLARALALLDGNGEEARVVGGAVRNTLMGRLVADYDIATTATPDVVIARAKAAGLRTIPTGIAHGTVTLLVGGRPFEVTTLREDIDTDGRHATVRFGRDFAQDALRRDFTINALSMGPDGEIHDYASGRDDIDARRVRFIGKPETRIREDYLRILRFFRFSAEYAEGPLDAEGLAAAIGERDGLARLSRERVRQELLKLLMAPRAAPIIEAISEAGLLGPLLQAVPQPRRLARLLAFAPEADAMLRLAALATIVVEDAARLRDRLRLSNAEADRLEGAARTLAPLHGHDMAPAPDILRGLLFDHGRGAATGGLALAAAAAREGGEEGWRKAARFLADTPEPHLPFSGADLIARGIQPGRALGEALKRLQAAWVRDGFPKDPRRLAELLATVTDDGAEAN